MMITTCHLNNIFRKIHQNKPTYKLQRKKLKDDLRPKWKQILYPHP